RLCPRANGYSRAAAERVHCRRASGPGIEGTVEIHKIPIDELTFVLYYLSTNDRAMYGILLILLAFAPDVEWERAMLRARGLQQAGRHREAEPVYSDALRLAQRFDPNGPRVARHLSG